jgi:hypothetical protein
MRMLVVEDNSKSALFAVKVWGRVTVWFAFDRMETEKYLVINYSKSPEGECVAISVVMYDDKSKVPKPSPGKRRWMRAGCDASTVGFYPIAKPLPSEQI